MTRTLPAACGDAALPGPLAEIRGASLAGARSAPEPLGELAALARPAGPERIVFDDFEAGQLGVELDDKEPQEIISWALETFGRRVSICTSFQADGMVILDMAWRIDPTVRVFTVDTGRLPQETYAFIDEVRDRYGMEVEVYLPDAREVETMVRRNGVNLFYRAVPLRLACCDIRKVRPLRRALADLDAWITGLRRDQWASRANIRKVEIDHDHGGLMKVNPLADWTEEEVQDYLRTNDVPLHPLYAKGYGTISCAPCTRAIEPGADARSGRWWWEVNAPKECGMHCSIETGGFEHEVEAILGEAARSATNGPTIVESALSNGGAHGHRAQN